jgi:hypothetical protein
LHSPEAAWRKRSVPGLGYDLDARDNHYDNSSSSNDSDMKRTELQYSSRERRSMMRIDTSDPGIDSAMEFVSRGPLLDLSQSAAKSDTLNARRRGRAIYLNDLLQFKASEQAPQFHSALLQWHQSHEQDDDLDNDEQDEMEHDMSILLAQARKLAQSPNTTSTSSPRQNDSTESYFVKRTKRHSRKVSQTSASTPEGVLGKVSLPHTVDFMQVNRAGSDEGEEVLNDSDAEVESRLSYEDASPEETSVLRAGLRFVFGCHDDLMKRTKSEGSGPAISQIEQKKSSPVIPTRSRSRSHSLIKALSIKSDRNSRYSVASSSGHESVLDSDFNSVDHIAGPSSRYGMVNVSALTSPVVEQKNPMDKVKPKDAANLSMTPPRSRRPSKLTTPSEEDEAKLPKGDVSHSGLASALQQMRRLDREKLQGSQFGAATRSTAEIDEMLRQEKAKTAALARELETIKTSISSLEKKETSGETNELSDIERGAKSEEEAMMMEAVAQASRDTIEAEEREAEWKSECEAATERVNVLEEALYQAMGLLAGQDKEIEGKVSFDQSVDPLQKEEEQDRLVVSSSRRIAPIRASLSPVDIDGRTSGASSPFYSAGEEGEDDDELNGPTPFSTSTLNTGSTFADTLKQFSQSGFNSDIDRKRRDEMDSHRGSDAKVPGWDQIYSDDETVYDRKSSVGGKSSLRSSIAGSRRESQASWIRHSILPPAPAKENIESMPTLELPQAVSPAEKKKKKTHVIDYSARAKVRRSERPPSVNIVEEEQAPAIVEHVNLYSDMKPAVVDEAKSIPDTLDDLPTDLAHDSWCPSIVRSSIGGRRHSICTTSSKASSSSKERKERPKLGHSKNSILGSMPPPSYSSDDFISSSASMKSYETQPSSTVSNGIAEHYEQLARERSGLNKPKPNAAFFSRRTRFTAS